MKKLLMTIALSIFTLIGFTQEKGDWYVGTGDITGVAWTDWAIDANVGYGVMDNLMIGVSVAQADSTVDMDLDFHARYFYKGYFAYVATDGIGTDGMKVGAGKMFTFRNNVYIDPKVVYDTGMKTTNLSLGFGFKF
jgi:hypothetical protein|tara:strand:- start:237 stop:644 length:408 start_codon:yes stop_codon:yes gene_type:complete